MRRRTMMTNASAFGITLLSSTELASNGEGPGTQNVFLFKKPAITSFNDYEVIFILPDVGEYKGYWIHNYDDHSETFAAIMFGYSSLISIYDDKIIADHHLYPQISKPMQGIFIALKSDPQTRIEIPYPPIPPS